MKTAARWLVRQIDRFAVRFACDTYGDTASLHTGPCGRCVGHAVPPTSPAMEV